MTTVNWNPTIDKDTVHCIGNGRIFAYSRGPEIFDMSGPYYSAPKFVQTQISQERERYRTRSSREDGSAVWQHEVLYSGGNIGKFMDYTAVKDSVYVRDFSLRQPMRWKISNLHGYKVHEISNTLIPGAAHVFMSTLLPGTLLYTHSILENHPAGYPVTDQLTLIIALSNGGQIEIGDDYAEFSIENGRLVFAIEKSAALAIEQGAAALNDGELLTKCRKYWADFTEERLQNAAVKSTEINAAADDIAVLCKTQQSEDGGILAGYNYHLSYVRDNYGAHRGLLAMGCYQEDKKLLQFYSNTYARYGKIQNAQGMGCEAFHIHENDSAEITGFICLMAMEYLEATGDEATVYGMFTLLKWCMDRQLENLIDGALPFNGDETYIAGGCIPRTVLLDGSLEATLLYHKAGERLLPWIEKKHLADSAWIESQKQANQEIFVKFHDNFIDGTTLYCNKPGYYTEKNAPAWRNGVRECGHGFGISFKTKNLRYVCAPCIENNPLEAVPAKRYELISVALMPAWIGSKLINDEILYPMVKRIYSGFKDKQHSGRQNTVGYDCGLLTYSLTRYDAQAAKEIAETALKMRDETGAWAEYYVSGKPANTKYRPYESGINIAALYNL